MSRYKIATKTDTLRYKIAKEVFGEIEDSDGVRDIPSWEIFEKCLEQHKRIAELEEQLKNAIVPKFKIGQEVWFVYDENDDCNYTILNKKVMAYNYFSYEGGYFEYAMSDDGSRDTIWYGYVDARYVFATKEEAQAKLEELRGK